MSAPSCCGSGSGPPETMGSESLRTSAVSLSDIDAATGCISITVTLSASYSARNCTYNSIRKMHRMTMITGTKLSRNSRIHRAPLFILAGLLHCHGLEYRQHTALIHVLYLQTRAYGDLEPVRSVRRNRYIHAQIF